MQVTTTKKRNRVWAILLLLFVFGLGLFVGASGVLIGFQRLARRAFVDSPEANASVDHFLGGVENRFTHKLGLTDRERAMVHQELGRTAQDFEAVRRTFLHAVRDMTGDTVRRICLRLPAEKAAELRKLAGKRLAPWGIPVALASGTSASQ